MPLCGSCHCLHPKTKFSNNQLKKNKTRKCVSCVQKSNTISELVSPSNYVKQPSSRESSNDLKTNINPQQMFIKWLQTNGCDLQHLTISSNNKEIRNVQTNKTIMKHKSILQVPLKCMITESVARKSNLVTTIENNLQYELDTQTCLALFLLQEKKRGTDSFYKPYIDFLPYDYHRYMPVFLHENQYKDLLKGSFILEMINCRRESYYQEFSQISKWIPFTFSEFVWAKVVVITRVFFCDSKQNKLHENDKEEALVPFADMLNHQNPDCTSSEWFFNTSTQCFEIRSRSIIPKGKEVFDSYGFKCNSRFFVNYGFTLPSNSEYNQCDLFIPVHPHVHVGIPTNNFDDGYSGYSMFMKTGSEKMVTSGKYNRFQIGKINYHNYNQTMRALFSLCRKMALTNSVLDVPLDEAHIPFQTTEVEISALKIIADAACTRQQSYQTTSDNEITSPFEMYSLQWNCANIIKGEQEVLQYWISLYQHANTLGKDMNKCTFLTEMNKFTCGAYQLVSSN